MKNDYEIRAQKFIMKIAPYLEDCIDTDDYEMALDSIREAMPNRKIWCASGCARTAFITSDYVVKVEHEKDAVECYGGGENEIRLYAEAVKDGMDYLFAKISPFSYAGRTYYIMPRIRGINEWSGKWAWNYMTTKEIHWCNEHGLDDLHCGNFGFRNHQLCIVDYASID